MLWKEVWNTGPGPANKYESFILYTKGLCMGTADLIPGVSGGTIAFITGIYKPLLEAVASLNYQVLKALTQLKIKEALSQVHMRFMVPLLCGIFSAIILLAHFMHYLLVHHPVPTWAAFWGLIGGSIIVMWRQLPHSLRPSTLLSIGIGAVLAFAMVSLIPVDTPESWWFICLCGAISTMAMILPGISGSFLMLILGKYEFITGAIKNPFVLENLGSIVLFASGGAIGLLSFTRCLNYLLKHYYATTMAFLVGILIGSMKKIWPWKVTLESKIVRGKEKILREANVMPEALDGECALALALILLGLFVVLFVDYHHRQKNLVS